MAPPSGSGSALLMRLQACVSQGCSHLSAWLGLKGLLLGLSLSCLLARGLNASLVVGRKLQLPCHVDFSIGLLECPYDMAACFPQSK